MLFVYYVMYHKIMDDNHTYKKYVYYWLCYLRETIKWCYWWWFSGDQFLRQNGMPPHILK